MTATFIPFTPGPFRSLKGFKYLDYSTSDLPSLMTGVHHYVSCVRVTGVPETPGPTPQRRGPDRGKSEEVNVVCCLWLVTTFISIVLYK